MKGSRREHTAHMGDHRPRHRTAYALHHKGSASGCEETRLGDAGTDHRMACAVRSGVWEAYRQPRQRAQHSTSQHYAEDSIAQHRKSVIKSVVCVFPSCSSSG